MTDPLFNANTNDSALLKKVLGVYITAGYGAAMPELKDQIIALHRDRVSALNFVPATWLDQVMALQNAHPDDLVRVAPSEFGNGSIIPGSAEFCTSSVAVADAWQTVFTAENKAIAAYGAKLQEEGKSILAAAYRDAAFWNTLYEIADSVANAPSRALNGFFDKIETRTKVYFAVGALLIVTLIVFPYVKPYFKSA